MNNNGLGDSDEEVEKEEKEEERDLKDNKCSFWESVKN